MTEIKIDNYEGWEVLYDTESRQFFGRKGRRHVRAESEYHSKQKDIEELIRGTNATDARKKARKDAEPLKFRRWVPETAEEGEVTLLSYTVQGLRIQRTGHEAPIRIANRFSDHEVLVIPDDVDARPLHEAEEAVRRAAEQMRRALADCTVLVKFKNVGGKDATKFHAAEDEARAAIALAKVGAR